MIIRFDQENIDPSLKGILVASHGPMAAGLLDSAAVIMGMPLQNAAALCLESEDDPFLFGKQLSDMIEAFPAGCLVLTDILGGTPYNQLLFRARKTEVPPFALTGACLPMLLTAYYAKDQELDEDAILESIREETQNSMINVRRKVQEMLK